MADWASNTWTIVPTLPNAQDIIFRVEEEHGMSNRVGEQRLIELEGDFSRLAAYVKKVGNAVEVSRVVNLVIVVEGLFPKAINNVSFDNARIGQSILPDFVAKLSRERVEASWRVSCD